MISTKLSNANIIEKIKCYDRRTNINRFQSENVIFLGIRVSPGSKSKLIKNDNNKNYTTNSTNKVLLKMLEEKSSLYAV